MNRSYAISFFIGLHIVLVFLQVHKHVQFIQQSFAKQKNERDHAILIQRKQLLLNELYALKNHHLIKTFAEKKLALKPIKLSQIRRISD
jgi:hypothetical protein